MNYFNIKTRNLSRKKNILSKLYDKTKKTFFTYFYESLKIQNNSLIITLFLILINWIQVIGLLFEEKYEDIWKNKNLEILFKTLNINYILKNQLSYEIFSIIIYIDALIVFGAFFLIFLVLKIKNKESSFFNIILIVNKYYINILSSILYIPIMTSLKTNFSCFKNGENFHHIFLKKEKCFSNLHNLNIFISIFVLILLIIYMTFQSFLYYEIRKELKLPFSKKISSCNFFLFFTNFIQIYFLNFFEFNINLIITLSLILAFINFYYFYHENPFYNAIVKKSLKILSVYYLWTVIIINLRYYISKNYVNNFFQIYILGIIFIFFIILFEENNKNLYILTSLKNEQDCSKIIKKINCLIYFWKKKEKFKKVDLMLNGFIEIHKQNCEKKNCFIKKYDLKNVENTNIFFENIRYEKNIDLISLIKNMFSTSLQRFNNNLLLRINYFFFILNILKNKHLAIQQLKIIHKTCKTLEEEFFIFRFKKILIKKDEKKKYISILKQKENKDLVIQRNFNKMFIKIIKKNIKLYKSFWYELSKEKPDLDLLKQLGNKIYILNLEIKKSWERAKLKKKKITMIFGKYLSEIQGYKKTGKKIIFKEKNKYLKIDKHEILDYFIYPESLKYKTNALIIISGENKDLGLMVNMTKEVTPLLGFTKKMILKNNFSDILPEFLKFKFLKIIKIAFSGKEICFNPNSQIFYLIKKNGYIGEFIVCIKKLINPFKMLVLKIKPKIDYFLNCFFIVNSNKEIEFLSTSCVTMFGITKNNLVNNNNIDFYFYNLFEDKKKFLWKNNIIFDKKYIKKDINIRINNDQCLILKVIQNQFEEKSSFIFSFNVEKKKNITDFSIIESHYSFHISKTGRSFIFKEQDSEKIIEKKKKEKINVKKIDYFPTLEKKLKYGKDIKILRLDRGKPAVILDNLTEDNKILESSKILKSSTSMISKLNKKGNKKNSNLHLTMNYLEKKKNLLFNINFFKIPFYFKLAIFLLHLIIGIIFFLIYKNSTLKKDKLSELNSYLNFYGNFNLLKKEIQTIIYEIQKLKIINNNEINFFDEITAKDSINFSINKIQNIEEKMIEMKTYLNNNNDFKQNFNDKIFIDLDEENKFEISYNESIKIILSNSYQIIEFKKHEFISNIPNTIKFIYNLSMNNFSKKSEEIDVSLSNFIEKNINISLLFLIIQILYFFSFFFIFLIILLLAIKIKKKQFLALSLFTDISINNIKSYIKNCENLLKSLSDEKKNLFLEKYSKVKKNECFEFIKKFNVKNKKLLLKKMKIKKNIFYRLFFFFILFEIILLTNFFNYKKNLENFKSLTKELKSISKIANDYIFSINADFLYFSDKSINILNKSSEIFRKKFLSNLFNINGEMYKNQLLNINFHSEKLNSFSNDLSMSNICSLINTEIYNELFKKSDFFYFPNQDECDNMLKHERIASFYKDGFSISFSKFRQNLNKILLGYENLNNKEKNKFFQNNYCLNKLEKFDYCIYNHVIFSDNDLFQNNYLNFFTEIWLKYFLKDINDFYIKNILKNNFLHFIAFLICFLIFYFFVLCNYFYFLIRDLKIVENMILMIPYKNYENSDYIQNYLKNEINNKMYN